MCSCAPAGQEVLEVLLQDPEAMGQRIGRLVDAVVDLQRLERTVQRNDEVGCVYFFRMSHIGSQVSAAAGLVPPCHYSSSYCSVRHALPCAVHRLPHRLA
jgi:hypothetical protein